MHMRSLAAGSLVAVGLAAPSAAQVPPPAVELELVADGLDSVTTITNAGDQTGRLFIVLADGRVLIHNGLGMEATPFLDIRSLVLAGGERGLLGLAFHPQYAVNGYLFVNYTRVGDGATVIARYRVGSNPNLVSPSTGVVLLVIAQPFSNHNGGQVAFGADGYLYIGMGDGGSGGDPQCHGQRNDGLLGKMLRIDVDQNLNTPPYYGIPSSNPYVGPGDPRDEVWAKGLRNPWRFSFDRLTGEMFIGDVGQGSIEEIDLIPPGAGGRNLGWAVMEGSTCYSSPPSCPGVTPPPCGSPQLQLPILEYGHTGGACSVTGGYRYRGLHMPHLAGKYVYGDLCTGALFAATLGSDGRWTPTLLLDTAVTLSTFGEDEAGELYLAHFAATGAVYRLRGPVGPGDLGGSSGPDLLWRHRTTGQNFTWLMTRTHASGGAALNTLADGANRVGGVADLNADRENDIVWRNQATGANFVWYMSGPSFVSSASLPAMPDTSWQIVGTGHFDGDFRADILWRNSVSGQNGVWFMNGTTHLGTAFISTVPDTTWQIVGVADFDNDGASDLLWRRSTTGENYLWFMRGTTVVRGAALPGVPDLSWRVVGALDLSGDGRTDIVWRHDSTGQDFVWHMSGAALRGGTWLDPVSDTNWRIVPSAY